MSLAHTLDGTIVSRTKQSAHFVVRLDDGREIPCFIAKNDARCLFGDLLGMRVSVVIRETPKPSRIVKLHRDSQ